jgi:hypothetical protein
MDLKQIKLNKSEWNYTEIPVSQKELEILMLINKGYNDVNIKYNNYKSLIDFLKIDHNHLIENYLYDKYFNESIVQLKKIYNLDILNIKAETFDKIKKKDLIRVQNNTTVIKENIYETILINEIKNILKYKVNKNNKWKLHYFTLYKLVQNNISNINRYILQLCNTILKKYNIDKEKTNNINNIIVNGIDYIENNHNLLKYKDITLYDHQKQLFTLCKKKEPKLILYIAPTGTGKTLSPLGLSNGNKILFVCGARHVGLSLARSAISLEKKIAFAFGCTTADDIRLHYYSAKDYTKNKYTGGIFKVDNSVGDLVDIMICDLQSYLLAMYYMLSFNNANNIILVWDEPTISLDYSEHEFHDIIKNNWKNNIIPNIILQSATLPKINELTELISDYKNKFQSNNVYEIISHDCNKSITLINTNGDTIMPHELSNNYSEIIHIVKHCENYLTLLRYFDFTEIVNFICYVIKNKYVNSDCNIDRFFESFDEINTMKVKLFYLHLLKNIIPENWNIIYTHFQTIKTKKIKYNNISDKIIKSVSLENTHSILAGNPINRLNSEQINPPNSIINNSTIGVYITTKDAYTLSDGPTLFITNDIVNTAKKYVKQSKIPTAVMKDINDKINYNNTLNIEISKLEKIIDDNQNKKVTKETSESSSNKSGKNNSHKYNRDIDESKDECYAIYNKIDQLRSSIKTANLNESFIPNKPLHLDIWAKNMNKIRPFTSDISDEYIIKIMSLNNIENSWKILLLMGIGVFTQHDSIAYTEIMKEMADNQKLYLIIASSDYIYGTNYQFCHTYLGKDLNLTQEKIIQAMGRVGRNNIQQEYSIRFRNNEQIMKIFTPETDKPEINNMNRLFNST